MLTRWSYNCSLEIFVDEYFMCFIESNIIKSLVGNAYCEASSFKASEDVWWHLQHVGYVLRYEVVIIWPIICCKC